MLTVNRYSCAGYLTKNPGRGVSTQGVQVANLNLAVNRKFKGAEGRWKEEVLLIGVEVWGNAAKGCLDCLTKGSNVYVEGRLVTKKIPEADGGHWSYISVVADRVQFLSPKAVKIQNHVARED